MLLIAAAFPVKWVLKYYLQKYYGAVEIIFVLFASQIFIAVIQGVYVNLYKARHLQRDYLIQMLVMLLIGVITNAAFYALDRRMEAFAYATLFTYLIWFIFCERKNVSLRYETKDYIAAIILVAVYFMLGMKADPIIGILVYLLLYVMIIKAFMPDVWQFAFEILNSILQTIKAKTRG